LLPDNEELYSKKEVNDKRQVVMKAFAGKTGQDEYELILKFGPRALSRYAKNLNLEECLPNIKVRNWLTVEAMSKQIIVQLD